jgi:transposase-like protein
LSGSVEVDEAYFGGKRKNGTGRPMRGDRVKSPVIGMVERKGRVIAKVVTDTTAKTLIGNVHEFVLPASTVYTDELAAYSR